MFPNSPSCVIVIDSYGSPRGFEWVGAEEVGDDLPVVVAEQGGLRCEEEPGESGGVGTHPRWGARVRAPQADVVLGADGVPLEERLVSHRHLKFVGHAWWCDPVGVRTATARRCRPRQALSRPPCAGRETWPDAGVHYRSSSLHDLL